MPIKLPGSNLPRPIRVFFGLIVLYSLVTCSRVHVKLQDQDGEPIQGAMVQSNIQPGNAFFFPSKSTVKYTNWRGRATLPGGNWFKITSIRKEGYQFRPDAQFKRAYGSTTLGRSATRFDRQDPLVIHGWKRGKQPDLTYVSGRVYFRDDVEQCTLTLVEPDEDNGLDKPLKLQLDIETDFVKNEDTTNPDQLYVADAWKTWFRLTDAELQDTDDLFMNRAPDSGYKDKVTLGPFRPGEAPAGIHPEDRKLFFKGKNGEFYGGAILFMDPDSGTKASLDEVNKQRMIFQFWFNFGGSRNVMREEKRTYWLSHHGNMLKKYKYCQEDPQFD